MAEKNILLIDDEETIQEVVQIGIEIEAGWQVETASSGTEGINLATHRQPDAILLDIMMPDMDGIATLSRLKSNAKTSAIPVIFLTAKTQAVEKEQFRNLGVADIITKPFNAMTLASQIAKILGWNF
ncbi:response regulator with CheY-like receiver domain and winged-helix DNA-binding domain [Xenococcus sp. PCC 7305]|uniref:response regulator n=1 Tax=Xenococcus sp. PCC 7305 TaxID=102125 RepID=UPI0002ABD354|nr:response regulator [Xenococcus sp. PCC 7305]ELS01354.1 response regulator with CheY-like receiver domain and winged-helix DNA-binding domain [Xenococcus sp. PCC 7305]